MKHRHERNLRFLDAALDPDANRSQREAALRYLATKLVPTSKARAWAVDELERMRRSCGQ